MKAKPLVRLVDSSEGIQKPPAESEYTVSCNIPTDRSTEEQKLLDDMSREHARPETAFSACK